jgi:CheY-like chemotaxis protein
MKILLIEDNPPSAEVYVRMLAQSGYSDVTLQTTGLEGLEAACTGLYEVCFIDLDLPDVDGLLVGLALVHHMRRGRIPTTYLVALTARTDTRTRDEAQRLGFDAWIGKPCNASDLTTTLDLVTPRGHRYA